MLPTYRIQVMALPLLWTPLIVTPQGPGYRDPVQDPWMNKDDQFLYSKEEVFFQLFRKKNDKSSSVLPFQAFLQYLIEFNLTKESEPLLVKKLALNSTVRDLDWGTCFTIIINLYFFYCLVILLQACWQYNYKSVCKYLSVIYVCVWTFLWAS